MESGQRWAAARAACCWWWSKQKNEQASRNTVIPLLSPSPTLPLFQLSVLWVKKSTKLKLKISWRRCLLPMQRERERERKEKCLDIIKDGPHDCTGRQWRRVRWGAGKEGSCCCRLLPRLDGKKKLPRWKTRQAGNRQEDVVRERERESGARWRWWWRQRREQEGVLLCKNFRHFESCSQLALSYFRPRHRAYFVMAAPDVARVARAGAGAGAGARAGACWLHASWKQSRCRRRSWRWRWSWLSNVFGIFLVFILSLLLSLSMTMCRLSVCVCWF